MATSSAKCPICGRGDLEARVIDDVFEFASEDGPVRVEAHGVPVEICSACGEILSGAESASVRHRAICQALGLLSPEDIRAIRKHLGLTQAEFSKLTGIGEATISRWERGRLLQNRANDLYLRLLAEVPQNLVYLKRAARSA